MQKTLRLQCPEATEDFGRRLAGALRAGDTLLLSGPTGAGKSLLARALIQGAQAQAGRPVEDVPSPTYTLVQTYDAGAAQIVHADLYRVSGPAEIIEIGLGEAIGQDLCLIEWPDRLGSLRPAAAVEVALALADQESDGRVASISAPEGSGLARRIAAVCADLQGSDT